MRFHLVYSGALPSSGNKPKPADVVRIRAELDPQLRALWETHNALQVLEMDGAEDLGTGGMMIWSQNLQRQLTRRELSHQHPEVYRDCCGALQVGEKYYRPLVRESLSLTCELDILFLRHGNPGSLISQGGDIDNRIKCLLDALRMPDKSEQDNYPPKDEYLYTLLQNDSLVSRLDVDTDRLLTPKTDRVDEVHLIIGVTLNVLRVGMHNMCLL